MSTEFDRLLTRIEQQAVRIHELEGDLARANEELAGLRDTVANIMGEEDHSEPAPDLPWHYKAAVERERLANQTKPDDQA